MSASMPEVHPSVPELLGAVLAAPEDSPFVVLRNAEALPEGLSGRDLDLALVPGFDLAEATRDLVSRAEGMGWQGACLSTRAHMSGVTFLANGEEGPTIHFDVFSGVRWLGVPLISARDLARETVLRHGIRQLTSRMETLVTVVHRVLHGGELNKAKYVDQLRAQLQGPDGAWLRSEFRRLLGRRVARELSDPEALEALCDDAIGRQLRASVGALVVSLRRQPLATLQGVVGYVVGQAESAFCPPGVIGRPGEPYPGLPGHTLSLELACDVSVYAFHTSGVRAPATSLRTLNESRYLDMLRRRWRFWTPLRWLLPSVYLWLQAKRAGVVLVDRLPLGMRIARALGVGRRWIAVPEGGEGPG